MAWGLYRRQREKGLEGMERVWAALLGLGIAFGILGLPSVGQSHEAFMVADVPLPLEVPAVRLLESGNWDELTRLFVNGTSPNLTSADKEPLLVVAARRDSTQAVAFLLDHHARVDASDALGNTALMWAADHGNVSVVEHLLDAGAEIDAQNHQGVTALMKAAGRGHVHVVKVLLEWGSDRYVGDYTGRQALDMARDGGHIRVIQLLM